MAVTTPGSASAYTTSVRQALNQKGITNDRIGYSKTGGVTIDGQSFINPEKVYSGTSYTSQNNFNNAWNSYQNAQKSASRSGIIPTNTPITPTGMPSGSGMGSSNRATPNYSGYSPSYNAGNTYSPYSNATSQNPYTSQIDSVIQNLMNYSQNQPAYDPYSSAEYKAAQAQANKSAQASIRAAQEAYGGAGMGRSYALGERAQGISSDANNYLMTQVVPQLMAAEQQRRQSEYNNTLNALTQLMSQQNRADGLVQQDFNNNLSIADMTGNYMPQGAQQIINQLLGLKQQAESQGTTADQRAALSNQANTLRAQLQAMGIDTSRLGSDVSLANASANLPTGIRTLAGQDQDLQRQNANLDAALAISDLTGRTVTPQSDWTGLYRQAGNENTPLTQAGLTNALNNAWATAQQLGYVTPELAALTGIPEGTRTLDAERIYSDIDAQIYNSLADQAATQTEAAEGMNVSQISTNINRALSAMGDNANLNSPTVRNQVEQMILTQTQDPVTIAQLYSMYGIPIPEDLQAEISGK